MSNIASLITKQATYFPYKRALIVPEKHAKLGNRLYAQLTFLQTETMINQYARGFLNIGIQKGDRVSLFVRPCLEFMPLVFALYKIGAIVVLIDPGMGRNGLLSCIERIAPKALIAIPQAMMATFVYPKKFRSVEIKVTVHGKTWLWGGHELENVRSSDGSPLDLPPTDLEDEASILFTSGSTGPAKGVRYTHGILHTQSQLIKEMYHIEADEIDLPCFPLFGLFSLAIGMSVVIPDMDPTKPALADPKLLLESIFDQGVTTLFASPALLAPFADYCIQNHIKLPMLRRILSAGAPIPPQLHEKFSNILSEGVFIHTPYGATESLPVATISSHEVLTETRHLTDQGHGTCVGQPAPKIEIQIIGITDDPISHWSEVQLLPTGTYGEICVKGPVVTTEYKEEPEHTKMAKIIDSDGKIWHRMGDIGYFDNKNQLWFCGRKSHRVVLESGETLFPVPCEALFNLHEDVKRSALVGVHGRAYIVIECHAHPSQSQSQIKQDLHHKIHSIPQLQNITDVFFHPSFPVDVRHNAKIHRLQLANWVRSQLK